MMELWGRWLGSIETFHQYYKKILETQMWEVLLNESKERICLFNIKIKKSNLIYLLKLSSSIKPDLMILRSSLTGEKYFKALLIIVIEKKIHWNLETKSLWMSMFANCSTYIRFILKKNFFFQSTELFICLQSHDWIQIKKKSFFLLFD